MKIGVSSYSFARYLVNGSLDYPGVIEQAAKLGFDGVDYSGLGIPADDPGALQLAGAIRQQADKHNMTIFCYAAKADFLKNPDGWEAEVERLKDEVNLAAELAVPVMRHDATFGYPDDHTGEATFESALPTLIKGCQAVADYAATKGVKTMVENHGFFAQGSIKNEQIVKGVDHDNFGALVDIGNFLCDDEDPVSATRRMAPLALHAHAKDFHVKPADAADPGKGWLRTNAKQYLRGSIIGHGNIDIPGCLRALKEGGYSGPVSVEFEGLEDNNEALTIGLENLRRYAAEVYGD